MKIAELNKLKAEEQLIIAKEKSQSLSILTTKTIQALTLTDEKVLKKYLDEILNSGERDIFIEMLKPLMEKSESLDDDERQYWYDILPSITNEYLYKLVKILMVESQKLRKLNEKYYKESGEIQQWMVKLQRKTHNNWF